MTIPDCYLSLMPHGHQKMLNEQHRSISRVTQHSVTSAASSTVSEFLEGRIKSNELEMDYLKMYQEGLYIAHRGGKIPSEQFQAGIGTVLGNFRSVNKNLRVLKRQRKIIEEDIEDEVEHHKRERGEDQEPDVSFLERAYTNTIVPRVMGASAKQRKSSKFDQKAFRTDVMEYYGAQHGDATYCHLTGWHYSKAVKAAHLVPKSLNGDEVPYIFGVGELVLSDPRNGKKHLFSLSSVC